MFLMELLFIFLNSFLMVIGMVIGQALMINSGKKARIIVKIICASIGSLILWGIIATIIEQISILILVPASFPIPLGISIADEMVQDKYMKQVSEQEAINKPSNQFDAES